MYSFSLIDENTVARLQKDGDIDLPAKKINVPKDERWNTKQMSSKLLAGILNGDSIPRIATSLTDVIGNNSASAVRNARTMVTGAENRGRLDSYENLEEQGVVQKKVWIATADDRTRESHIELDGEEVDVGEPFSNGLMYPADPNGDPAEVWNCRCSMRTHIVGFRKKDGTISPVDYERDRTLHDEQMEAEKQRRGIEDEEKPATEVPVLDEDGKILRDYDTDFAKYYGNDFYNSMCDLVDDCDNENLKEIWQRYQADIGAKDPNFKGHPHESVGNIHVNKEKDIKGSDWQPPYETTFHESGHAIDYLTRDLADTNGIRFMYSSAYENGLFPATIRDEVADMVKAKDIELKALFKEHKEDFAWLHEHGFISDYSWNSYQRSGQFFGGNPTYSKSFAYAAVQKEIREISGIARADLSDILEGATDGKISCGYGHGKSYWKKILGVDEKLATEAFAEMTSATITNDKSLEVIKQYLPKSYSVYNDMLKDIAQKGGK